MVSAIFALWVTFPVLLLSILNPLGGAALFSVNPLGGAISSPGGVGGSSPGGDTIPLSPGGVGGSPAAILYHYLPEVRHYSP